MSRKLSCREMAVGGYKFFRYLIKGGILNVNLEVTKRCNARCSFCDYWKESPPEELEDYTPIICKLDPLSVSLTGGEPLLREDLVDVISSLRSNFGFLFLSLITNGSLLSVDKGLELWKAGLDEFSISLDYLDERHDEERGIPGLAEHILSVAPQLAAAGVNLCFNVVLKKGNYREVPKIISVAYEKGIKVSLSTYNCWRTDNSMHMIEDGDLSKLVEIIREIKDLKISLGNVTTSEYYLDRIPAFFREKAISGCTAGINWVQVTPDGMIKRCSDYPVSCHFSEWKEGYFAATDCGKCWYSCRGAAQEPWTLKRFISVVRDTFS